MLAASPKLENPASLGWPKRPLVGRKSCLKIQKLVGERESSPTSKQQPRVSRGHSLGLSDANLVGQTGGPHSTRTERDTGTWMNNLSTDYLIAVLTRIVRRCIFSMLLNGNPQPARRTFILRSSPPTKMVPLMDKTVGTSWRVGSRNSLAMGKATSEGGFRSKNQDDHDGAFFELFMHELLSNLGFRICEVHPTLPDSTNRPDFLVCDGTKRFYLEAAVTGRRSGPFTLTKPEQELIEELEHLASPDFNLLIEIAGELSHSIKKAPFRSKFSELLLEGHDPDVVKAQVDARGTDAAPSVQYDTDGWRIQAWLSLVSIPARICGSRRIKVNFRTARRVNAIDPVRNKLRDKGSNYGDPQIPLVIAVHTRDISYNGRRNDLEVLFGKERLLCVHDVPELDRAPDGLWSMGHGMRIGAFLSVQKADMWNFPHASGCLFVNPSQNRKDLPEALLRLPQGILDQGRMAWFDGVEIGQLLAGG